MTAFVIFLGLLALVWLWLLLSPAHRETFSIRLEPDTPLAAPADPLPMVTVIVPARNEADMLPKTIPTICRQDYPHLHVILIDDQSDDDSSRVVEQLQRDHPNLQVIHGTDRPPGWMGKCWAVKQGVDHWKLQQSTIDHQPSNLLLFTDADVIYHRRAVRQAVSYLIERKLDMLSLLPRCLCVGPMERIGVGGLISILTMLFPLGWANDPRKKSMALAAGGFILIRPATYEKAGGHECVRSEMIEDVNLARHLKRSGAHIECRMTRDLLTTRMYEGLADMWEGLTKNAYAGMEYQPRKFWVGLIVGVLATVFPPIYLLLTILWAFHARTPLAYVAFAFAASINFCMVIIHSRAVRYLQLPWIDIFFMPLSAGLYDLIALDSAWQHHFRGGNVWKGRRYDRQMLLSTVNEPEQ